MAAAAKAKPRAAARARARAAARARARAAARAKARAGAQAASQNPRRSKSGTGKEFIMNMSRIFIERPVATSVLFVSIMFFGWLAFTKLPVNDLLNVDFPTITVTARLPGASPEIMANTVALPLEREFSRIAGVDEMVSSSTSGNTRITLTFSLKRDIDSAAQDVGTAISQAARRLPPDLPEPPALRKLNPGDFAVLILAVTSKHVPMQKIDEFADTHVAQRFTTVNGVAQAQVVGSQKYAVRLYVDPNALAKRGL